MQEPEQERELRLRRYEDRFRDAGLPLFDEDFSAATNVFNRVVPLLALVFIGEMLGAVQLEWPLLVNLAAMAAGLAILLGAAGLINVWRGRRFRSIPDDVGTPELAAFVLLPALLPLIFGGQLTSAVVTAAANLVLLGFLYAIVGYGLPSILHWVVRRLYRQLRASFMLLARAVPLLLIFALLAFVNTEMWQVFAAVSEPGLVAIGLLFFLLGTGFLFARLPREVRDLERQVGGEAPPLSIVQRRNVGLVLFVSQAVQILTVALMVGAFFVVFGAIAITPGVREAWIGSTGEVLVSLTVLGERFELTSELFKVAGGLAAFSGLYFAIAMLTDSTYRDEFLEELTEEMQTVFRERAEYLRLRAAGPAGDPA